MACLKSAFVSLVLALSCAVCLGQLSVSPAALPEAYASENYYQEVQASGGTAPYSWTVRGKLPPGIIFDSPSGTLTGIPTEAGEYRFNIVVTDNERRTFDRTYVLRVSAGNSITIAWTRAPAVANNGIGGEVEITNPGRETYDLTFITVAVNEIGRATALGYQHFSLSPGKQRIPFSGNLPRGTYVVHADAVGEIARTRTIRRARLQTQPLVVP